MNFKPVTPFAQKEFSKYESLRSIYMSEGHFLNQFLWENYYHTQYATDDIALYLYVKRDSAQGFFAPLCREERPDRSILPYGTLHGRHSPHQAFLLPGRHPYGRDFNRKRPAGRLYRRRGQGLL